MSLDEWDYFGDLPIVLSVSQLAQPLDETPAAATVPDRNAIGKIGTRDACDVLHLVPEFLVSGWDGAEAVAAYRNVLDQMNRELQAFIDGRSVHSTSHVIGKWRPTPSSGEDMPRSCSDKKKEFQDRAPFGNPNPTPRGIFVDWNCEAQRTRTQLQHSAVLGRDDATGPSSPRRADTLAIFPSPDADFDLTPIHSAMPPMTRKVPADTLPGRHRTDARLARRVLIGPPNAEATLTVEATRSDHQQFFPGRFFNRRAVGATRPED